jgi:hypothetical protein
MDDILETASVRAAVSTILEDATEPLYLVRPSAELLEIVIETATDCDSPPVHVLAVDTELNAVRNHFPSAARAADLVEADRLTLTPAVPDGWGTAVVTGETAYAFASVDGHELVLQAADVPAEIHETWDDYRDVGKRFNLRTPPWSVVTATLTESLSDDVCADFKTSIEVLDSLDTPTANEIDSALLVAARHEVLLYDLTHWAEDIQLRSKATFSRAKRDLEDLNILDSEKVPIDVGRPRLRLTLTDKYASLAVPELLREVNTVKGD